MTMTEEKSKPRCPEAKPSWYNGQDICTLNSKLCVLELGGECPYYNEWLEEKEHGDTPG